MRDKKGFYKGLIAGIAICVMLVGVVSLSGCLRVGITGTIGQSSSTTDSSLSSRYGEVESKLNTIQSIIDTYYLDDEDVNVDTQIEGIYKGYVDSLGEAYTVYYTPEEYSALMESTSGTYSGIGVVMTQNVDTGLITVVRPFPGAPGAEAGMLKDDVLYKIEGEEVTGGDLSEVVGKIKGEEGTSVSIEIYRPSEDKYYTLDVERKTIEVPMVEYKMLDNKMGYVAIYEFEETTSDQFNAAITDLTNQGMKGLIIDLRDNPGGLVDSATAILDRILPKDQLLVYTVDKNESKEEVYSKDDETIDVPMVVLINENSASASEIVSGCLQDYGTAQLVGTTSYGKGIVQYVLPLDDGSGIKLTSAKYYTPNGRNIHGIGIDPDVEVELDTETDSDEQLLKAQQLIMEQIQ